MFGGLRLDMEGHVEVRGGGKKLERKERGERKR